MGHTIVSANKASSVTLYIWQKVPEDNTEHFQISTRQLSTGLTLFKNNPNRNTVRFLIKNATNAKTSNKKFNQQTSHHTFELDIIP